MQNDADEPAHPSKSRQEAEAHLLNRSAVTALLPMHKRIQTWQIRTAHLVGKVAKSGRTESLVDESTALRGEILAELKALEYLAAESPPAVAATSRFADTERALNSMLRAVEKLKPHTNR